MRRAVLLVLLAACGGKTPVPATTKAAQGLAPSAQLERAAMALTGTRPSLDALQAVDRDPSSLPTYVDALLARPEFAETVRDIYSESLLVRVDFTLLPNVDVLARRGYTRAEVNSSVMEEPLKLVEHVVETGRPFTEIATAPYTMADRIVADVWGLPYDDATGGWQEATFPDARPAAGVLSTSAMWIRHESNGFNFGRERANAVSRALLCYDFLSRDVVIDGSVNLADPDAVAHAVSERPACASCHQGLDPLASYFFVIEGNLNLFAVSSYPLDVWRPKRINQWIHTNHRPPGYFGDAGTDMADLGRKIAADPRFAACAARTFFGYFAGLEPDDVPFDAAARLQASFEKSGYDARALAKAAVLDPAFQTPALVKAHPEQLARMVEDLTGFHWKTSIDYVSDGAPFGEVDLARSDVFGFRALAGGIDGQFVTQPARTTTASSALFLRSLADKASGRVVDDDLDAAAGSRRLLTRVEASTFDEPSVRAQLADLEQRLYGQPVSAQDVAVTEAFSVFQATLLRTGNVRHAWKTTLAAMLQDLRIAFY